MYTYTYIFKCTCVLIFYRVHSPASHTKYTFRYSTPYLLLESIAQYSPEGNVSRFNHHLGRQNATASFVETPLHHSSKCHLCRRDATSVVETPQPLSSKCHQICRQNATVSVIETLSATIFNVRLSSTQLKKKQKRK